MWKKVFMIRTINRRGKTLSMRKRDDYFGVDKVESKEYGTITGNCCLVFDYTGNKIITIDSYKR